MKEIRRFAYDGSMHNAAKEPAKIPECIRKIITWDASIDSLCCYTWWKPPVDGSARGIIFTEPILQTSCARQKTCWSIKFHGSCNWVLITRIRVGNATLMQHVLFNDTTRRAYPSGRSVRVITNIVVYCESGTLSHGTPYPAVIGARLSTLLTERSWYSSTNPLVPSSRPSSHHLTSSPCLSRRQPVKNDRGVSLVGQWQIEYILASSEKRVLRFVYRLSCYAKERNFCRLRIRRIDPYPYVRDISAAALHTHRSTAAVHNHYR